MAGITQHNLLAAPYDWRIPPSVLEQRDAYFTRSVLGYWVGVRRPFHHSLFLTAPRMVLPQDPSTDHSGSSPCSLAQQVEDAYVNNGGGRMGGVVLFGHSMGPSSSCP